MTRSAPTSLITNSITCFEWITDGVTDIVNLQDEACTRLADTIHRAPRHACEHLERSNSLCWASPSARRYHLAYPDDRLSLRISCSGIPLSATSTSCRIASTRQCIVRGFPFLQAVAEKSTL